MSDDLDPELDAYGDDLTEDHDPLFGEVLPGPQADGTLVADLGWAGMGMLEALGIEHLVGVRGFDDAGSFYLWMQNASGSPLADWHGVHLRLYECWYLEPMEGTFCYGTLRDAHDKEALASRAVDVFCLRHKAWKAEGMRRRAFNCARTRSYCEAAHVKRNPGAPVSPSIMADSQGDGIILTGIRSGDQEETVLAWPSPDMDEALSVLIAAKAEGVSEIHMWENGIGVQADKFTDSELAHLLKVDRYYGGDMMLSDVLTEAGLMQR